MGMFFFKVAPGLRLRFTRTGIRAGIGPRMARLHVGDGGLGVSTGAGPFAYYHSLSRSRRGGGTAAAERAQRAVEAAAALDAIAALHQRDFTPVQPPVAPLPDVPTLEDFTALRQMEAVAGISRWRFGARPRARRAARESAPAEHARLVEAARADQESTQKAWDDWWSRLLAGDPDVTIEYINDALEDNDSPAGAVRYLDGEASVVIHVPPEDVVPERGPALTDAGNPTTRALSKTARAGLYAEIVFAHVLLTARELFAVAPAAERARLVALRRADVVNRKSVDIAGIPCEVMVACEISRRAIDQVADWSGAASDIFTSVAEDVHIERMLRHGLAPLDLTDEPDLAELLTRVEG